MAITTYAGIEAGVQPPAQWRRTGTTTGVASTTGVKGMTDWYISGVPSPASANASGVNGQALTYPVTGAITRNNPASGNAYIGNIRVRSAANNIAVMWLVDRLWENSGLSVTATTSQAITSATLPARDYNASTNGEGVMVALEWSTGPGAGTPNTTLTYTNSAGTGSKTATMVGTASLANGAWEIFDLAAGDIGVRSIQAYQADATRTSGACHLVMFRVLAQFEVPLALDSTNIDGFSLALPRVLDGSVLQTVSLANIVRSFNLLGSYTEVHG